ncbi:MAG: hypothetical protein AAGU74_10390 [Bacillota bacterium]
MQKRAFAALLALVLLLLCACDATTGPSATATPELQATSSPLPEQTPGTGSFVSEDGSYSLSTNVVYFPEGCTQENAKFTLTYTLPEFLGGDDRSEAMNDSVKLYLEDLFERVNEQYLASVPEGAEIASDEVSAQISVSRGYTNLIISEHLTIGESLQDHISTIVFDDRGRETGLEAIAGLVDGAPLVAQLVYNRMDQQRDVYFSDMTMEQIEELLDLYNAFAVTDNGFKLYFGAGTIAAEVEGPIWMDIAASDLYPSFVGDVLPAKAYVELMPVIDRLAAASAVNFESFDGSPSAYVATLYMADAVNALPYPPKAPIAQDGDTLIVPEKEFLALYEAYFRGAFPGIDDSGGTIVKDGASYRVEVAGSGSDYHVVFNEAQSVDNMISLKGSIVSATGADTAAAEVASVEVDLVAGEGSAGYRITSLMIL